MVTIFSLAGLIIPMIRRLILPIILKIRGPYLGRLGMQWRRSDRNTLHVCTEHVTSSEYLCHEVRITNRYMGTAYFTIFSKYLLPVVHEHLRFD